MNKVKEPKIKTAPRISLNIWKFTWSAVLKALSKGSLRVINSDGTVSSYGEKSEQPALMEIHDASFYRKVILGGSIALGEAYVEGLWSSPDLSKLLVVLSGNCEKFGFLQKGISFFSRLMNRGLHLLRRNSKKKSLSNIQAHYDLSNEFYKTFLDQTMTYSSALFEGQEMSLESAQINKIKRILDLSEIDSGNRILEIGSGWGALAIEAAQRGCSVKTITLSKEQFDLTQARISEAGLERSIEIHMQDYREEDGLYDAVLSCEMIEAVGQEYLEEYFKVIRKALKPKGRAVIQAITIRDQDYEDYARSCDWIQKHIFPGGHLPSMGIIEKHIANIPDFEITEVASFGQDYAKTLSLWQENFFKAKSEVSRLGFDEAFQRKWNYYFSYCIAGFTNQMIDVRHIVFERK